MEFPIVTKNGEERWLEHNCSPVFDEQGKYMGRRGNNRDITARKLAEAEQLNSHNQLDSIFRAAPTGIGVVIDRKFQIVNDLFVEMLGYSEGELIGSNSRMIYPNDVEFEKVGKNKYEQIREYGTGTVETVLRKKDGSLIDVLLSSTPLDLQDLSQGVT
ncbi:MAG: PAS domain-containing protein, partial [Desulfuromusa sp.]|nr:PAS domain-containing protein [Desulfuromusa sp.]